MIFFNKVLILTSMVYGIQAMENIQQQTLLADAPVALPHRDCPKVDNINIPVFIIYPNDCQKYYSCLNGLAYLKECPSNLLWNPDINICDYPENTKCKNNQSPASNDLFYQPYPNDCNKYYKCEPVECPSQLYWNQKQKKCDIPLRAQCPFNWNKKIIASEAGHVPVTIQSTTLSTEPVTPPTAPHADLTTPLPPQLTTSLGEISIAGPPAYNNCSECVKLCSGSYHMYLPYPWDCHKFIQCNGWAYIHTCPDNLYWNNKLSTCDRFCVQ